MKTIGVISDTHGLLRPEALDALRGADFILHAGDIGAPEVLERLRMIADLAAIKGNNDRDAWARGIPDTLEMKLEGVGIYMIHNVRDLEIDPAAAGYRVVVSGHSHMPSIREESGVIYLNPGSAGPRRFKLPVSSGMLVVDGERVEAQLQTLVG